MAGAPIASVDPRREEKKRRKRRGKKKKREEKDRKNEDCKTISEGRKKIKISL